MAYLTLRGSDLTGNDGDANRTYTLTSSPTSGTVDCRLNNTILIPDVDFTYVSATRIITFLIPVLDIEYVSIFYWVNSDSITLTGSLYTTPTLVEYEIRATEAFSSSTVPNLTSINTWIEEESRYIDSNSSAIYCNTLVSSEFIDYDGNGILRFPKAPLASISEVKYNNSEDGTSWVTLQEGYDKDYLSYLDEGEIEFLTGSNGANLTPISGKKRFCLTYYYGVSPVPLQVRKLATLLVAKRAILGLLHSQANTEGGSVTVGTISVSDPTSFSHNHIKSINTEVDTLMANLGNQTVTYRLTREY